MQCLQQSSARPKYIHKDYSLLLQKACVILLYGCTKIPVQEQTSEDPCTVFLYRPGSFKSMDLPCIRVIPKHISQIRNVNVIVT
ncbi:hypothetical protein KP509_25G032400 [Ceratopteris richardii]|nr:hypothetical protein KP509_25G032400 [Ceratopteris richardii]